MKVGTVLLVLILALVVLGFLFSDNIQVRKDLKEALEKINQLQIEREQLIGQLSAANQNIQILTARVTELETQAMAACSTQTDESGPTSSPSTAEKKILSAGLLLLPALAVGIATMITYLRRRRNYILLTDAEREQIIHQRRGQRI